MSSDQWLAALGIGAAVLMQFLQTIQIAVLGRKVSRTLMPPPLRVPPPTAAPELPDPFDDDRPTQPTQRRPRSR